MDSSWLVNEEVHSDNGESESDSENIKTELESRLYSIVHYNDLSQPLPPQLSKHYSVHCEDDGKLVVEVKDSLENIQSEEAKCMDNTFQNSSGDTELDRGNEVENNNEKEIDNFITDLNETQEIPRKRFRYSDINLDTPDKESNKVVEEASDNISYFKITPRFFKDFQTNSILKRMIIPPSFETPNSDWKQTANANFISFGPGKKLANEEIIKQMVNDLASFNPSINKKELYSFAHQVYYHNKKLIRQSEKKKRKKKAKQINKLNISNNSISKEESNKIIPSLEVINNSFKNKELILISDTEEEARTYSKRKLRRSQRIKMNANGGSISLNISPFKPTPTIDLVSDDDFVDRSRQEPFKTKLDVQTIDCEKNFRYGRNESPNLLNEEIQTSSQTLEILSGDELLSSKKIARREKRKEKQRRKKAEQDKTFLGQDQSFPTKLIEDMNIFPTKWTEDMINYYTKPSPTKLHREMNEILSRLERKSTPDDWKLDPLDMKGKYHRNIVGKYKNHKCPNCNERGHLIKDCPKPLKTPSCYLCGEFYHNSFSCPNRICLKCGVYLSNDSYECRACYYHNFNYDTPCSICGIVTHRAENCPDLWRSFHATTGGDKKIPENIIENKVKYCCNCSNRGHFSHRCPFPAYGGEQPSSFVTNYSASSCEIGTTEIVLPPHLSYIVEDSETDRFLQDLSNTTEASIQLEELSQSFVLRIRGTFDQCRRVKTEIQGYVNSNKRKRSEGHHFRRKRQRLQ